MNVVVLHWMTAQHCQLVWILTALTTVIVRQAIPSTLWLDSVTVNMAYHSLLSNTWIQPHTDYKQSEMLNTSILMAYTSVLIRQVRTVSSEVYAMCLPTFRLQVCVRSNIDACGTGILVLFDSLWRSPTESLQSCWRMYRCMYGCVCVWRLACYRAKSSLPGQVKFILGRCIPHNE